MADESQASCSTPQPRQTGGVRMRGGSITRGRGLTPSESSKKKTFVPTIPQRRIKKENRQCDDQNVASEKKGNFKDFKRERGRGRGRREYVCVTGAIFGEGLGQDKIKRESFDTSSTTDTRVFTSVFKPVQKKSKQELADEENLIKNEDENDYSGSDDEDGDLPIIIPFKTLLEMNVEKEVELKQEPKIKLENQLKIKVENEIKQEEVKTEAAENPVDIKPVVQIKEEKRLSVSDDIRNIFCKNDDETQELLLIQFPAQVLLEDEDEAKKMPDTSAKSENSSKENEPEQVSSPNLMDIEEGFIGKLQLMKSGAIRLVCGSTIMELDQNKANFLEELISVRQRDDSAPEAIQLGQIARHVVISPVLQRC